VKHIDQKRSFFTNVGSKKIPHLITLR